MNRRDFVASGIAALLLAPAVARAQVRSGKDFTLLTPPRPVITGERIEIIEFFYYGCPICYETQPHLSRWLNGAPDHIALRRVPALSIEGWTPFAKLFYTLEMMGEIQRLHWPVYDNFHFDNVRLNDEKIMVEWIARNGVDKEKFEQLYASPQVEAKLEESREMMKDYDIRAVPTFVVDGKYVTSARVAGGTRQLLQVVDQLVRQARTERR
jgi:thiol:disulfide interchange protein DsbA